MMWKTATATALATCAGLALTQTALGAAGDLTPVQPITGSIEVVSPGETGDTSLIIFAPTAIGTPVAAGYTTDGVFQMQLLDATGAAIGGLLSVLNADVTEHTNGAVAGIVDAGDLVQINVMPLIQLFGGAAYGFNITFNDGDGSFDSFTLNADGFPGQGDDSDTLDMTYELNKNAPTISSVLINDADSDGDFDELFIVGNFDLLGPANTVANSLVFPTNAGVANPNNTTNGALSVADFEFDNGATGTFANFGANEFASVDVLPNGQTFLRIVIGDPTMSTLSVGDPVRVAAGGDVWDGTGGFMGGTVNITQKTPVSIDSAEWKLPVAPGATVAGAIQVSLNLAVSTAGNATFWNNGGMALIRSSATASDLSVTAAAIDGADNTKINLTVASAAVDEVAVDGLEGDGAGMTDGDSFDLEVDAATGTPPSDIFGTALTGTSDTDITDGIPPTRGGAIFALDMNADGQLDAFGMDFDEAMDVTGGAPAGFTLTRLAATVHPNSLFMTNLATGEFDPTAMANEATIAVAGDATDEFSASTFSRESDDTTNRLSTNNVVIVSYDPAVAAFQTADMTPADATPGTFDVNFATVAYDAMMSGLTDANGNAPGADLVATNISVEEASPLLAQVNHNTGDNEAGGGSQRINEQDGTVGDAANNNVGRFLFNEPLNVANTTANIDETRFRFGNEASDLFAGGDFVAVEGAGNNIVALADGSGSGFDVGDSASILSNSGVEDNNGNEFGATTTGTTVGDATAPYIPLQQDVNGATITSAFTVDQDSDGFADIIRMFFTKTIASTVADADFSVAGVTLATGSVAVSGNVITITLPTLAISASSPVNVTYNGAAAAATIADASGNAIDAVNTTFSVAAIPTPNADGEFTAVMNIAGTITGPDGNPAPAGTKVFGFIAVPVIKSVSGTMSDIGFTIDDSSSLEAWTNWLLGIDTSLYLYDDQGDMTFENDKFNDGQDSLLFVTAKFNASGSTWTAKGTTTPSGVDSQPAKANATNGRTTSSWDVLRSSDGTAHSLLSNGFSFGGQPIASAAVLLDDNGGYLLHMTAPESIFNGSSRLNAEGWPVIIVVELTTGERLICSGLTNGADNQGPILFGASQLDQDSSGNALSDLPFNINLATNVHSGMAYPGWNLMGDDRNSGFANKSSDIPDVLPRGVVSNNVILGTDVDLDNVFPLNQFPAFEDSNGDGDWTSADDGNTFDGIVIDINCFDYIAFTMTSDGVQVASPAAPDGITAFTGGYGLGLFNGDTTAWGFFMFGPSRGAGNIFNSGDVDDLNNNATLGWILNTASNSETAANFLTNNQADFNIEFNRTSANMVEITTAATGGGDQDSTNSGQAYVTHYPEQ